MKKRPMHDAIADDDEGNNGCAALLQDQSCACAHESAYHDRDDDHTSLKHHLVPMSP